MNTTSNTYHNLIFSVFCEYYAGRFMVCMHCIMPEDALTDAVKWLL